MNFQTVAANNGNLVAMLATVVELGNQKLNVNQKPIQSVKLRDDAGEEHNATINKGKGRLLDSSALGQRLSFNLSTYRGTTRDNQPFTGFSGFWNDKAQINQPAPQGQRPAPNAPQQPQGNNQKEMRIIRGNSLNAICSAMDIPLDMAKDYLLAGVQFILTGKWDVKASYNDPEPDPDIREPITADGLPVDDDIPF